MSTSARLPLHSRVLRHLAYPTPTEFVLKFTVHTHGCDHLNNNFINIQLIPINHSLPFSNISSTLVVHYITPDSNLHVEYFKVVFQLVLCNAHF